jgi:hypothetical protein
MNATTTPLVEKDARTIWFAAWYKGRNLKHPICVHYGSTRRGQQILKGECDRVGITEMQAYAFNIGWDQIARYLATVINALGTSTFCASETEFCSDAVICLDLEGANCLFHHHSCTPFYFSNDGLNRFR